MTNTRVVAGPGFRICFDDEPDYLRAYVFDGSDSVEVSSAMWHLLGDECRARGAYRLLVLEDLLSTVEVPQIGQVIRGFADSVGDADDAYVIPYPYWVDTRLVGINAGYPTTDYALNAVCKTHTKIYKISQIKSAD